MPGVDDNKACEYAGKLGVGYRRWQQPGNYCSAAVSWWLRRQFKDQPLFDKQNYFDADTSQKKHYTFDGDDQLGQEHPRTSTSAGVSRLEKLQVEKQLQHPFTEQDIGYILYGSKYPVERKSKPKVEVAHKVGPLGVNELLKTFQEVSTRRCTAKFAVNTLTGIGHAMGVDARTSFLYFDPNLGVFKFPNFDKFMAWYGFCFTQYGKQPQSAFGLIRNMQLFMARFFTAEKE